MNAITAKSVSIRIDSQTYERVRRLASAQDAPMTQVVARAIADAEERAFWRDYHEGLARLKADPEAWAAHLAESRELEGTLADGLEPDEDWSWLKAADNAGELDLAGDPERA
jgi:hypothetical protein